MGRFFIAFFLFFIMVNLSWMGDRVAEIRDLMKGAQANKQCTMMVVNVPNGTATICADRLTSQ